MVSLCSCFPLLFPLTPSCANLWLSMAEGDAITLKTIVCALKTKKKTLANSGRGLCWLLINRSSISQPCGPSALYWELWRVTGRNGTRCRLMTRKTDTFHGQFQSINNKTHLTCNSQCLTPLSLSTCTPPFIPARSDVFVWQWGRQWKVSGSILMRESGSLI